MDMLQEGKKIRPLNLTLHKNVPMFAKETQTRAIWE